MNQSALGPMLVCRWVITMALAAWALAGTTALADQRISPPDGLGRASIQHAASNEAGDFVAVSHTLVFVGNLAQAGVEQILELPNADFGLGVWRSMFGDVRVTYEIEFFGTRLDLNENGDFVVATNRTLWVGSTRNKTIRQVFEGERFTEFQQVAINDAGQYVAVSGKTLVAGAISEPSPQLLIAESTGTFRSYYAFDNNRDQIWADGGRVPLALNERGQFIAATSSVVYGGNVSAARAEVLFEEARIGFRTVRLADSGYYIAVTDNDIIGGQLP